MRWIPISCASVLVFDTLASLAARALDFEYALLFPGSLAIYFLYAFLAARALRTIRAGSVVGAALALTDATLGWVISWAADEVA